MPRYTERTRRSAEKAIREIKQALFRRRRHKDIGRRLWTCFLSMAVTEKILAATRSQHDWVVVHFTLNLNEQVYTRYLRMDGGLDCEKLNRAFRKFLRSRLTAVKKDGKTQSRLSMWSIIEIDCKDGRRRPHFHGLIFVPHEVLPSLRLAMIEYSKEPKSRRARALKMGLIETPDDAVRWAVYCMKSSDRVNISNSLTKIGSQLWARCLPKEPRSS